MTTLNTQLGVATEGTWGTATTVTRFFEYNSESIKGDFGRVESTGLRSGQRVIRSDRFMPYHLGASGSVEFDVMTKGFGLWLVHLCGSVATAGPTDSTYTHTGTVGSLLGDSFTMQVNRPFHPSATNQAFTYNGGKVTGWELGCDVQGVLTAKLDCDFQDEATSTALASASYPATATIFTFLGGQISIGGSNVDLTSFKLSVDNKLQTDRRYLKANGLKKEQVESAMRDIKVEMEADFTDLTQYNRAAAATAAGAVAQVIATFTGPILIGASTFPSVTITIPVVRLDEFDAGVSGPDPLSQKLTGVGMSNGSNSEVTIAYATADTTP